MMEICPNAGAVKVEAARMLLKSHLTCMCSFPGLVPGVGADACASWDVLLVSRFRKKIWKEFPGEAPKLSCSHTA